MLYLVLAVLSSSLISVGMRLSGKHVTHNISMLAVNYATCSLLAALFTEGGLLPQTEGIGTALGLGLVGGVLYLGGFVLFQWNVAQNGVVIPSTIMKLGVMIPILLSVVLFSERPSLPQLVGFAAALCAILLIHFDGKSERVAKWWALPLLLVASGLADAMSKFYEEWGVPALEDQFLFYIFFTALLLSAALILRKKQRLGRAELFYGLLVGIPNYFSSRFLLLSLSSVPAVVAYPTFSVGTIVAVTCAGILLFRERLSPRRWLAMGVILVSLVLLNL